MIARGAIPLWLFNKQLLQMSWGGKMSVFDDVLFKIGETLTGDTAKEWICLHDWCDWYVAEKGLPHYARYCLKCTATEEKIRRDSLDIAKLPNYNNPDEKMINELLGSNASYVAFGLTDKMIETVSILEKAIEGAGKTCRVLILHRSTVNLLVGNMIGIVGQVAHNIATMNPSYEIVRDLANNKIIVVYCDHYESITWW
jgi:hypothetical protein